MPFLSPDFLATVADDPGVYLMIDAKAQVIYVGKARNLRKRLASYVHFRGSSHSKTAAMIRRVEQVETILTRTEKEALILEASLIKKHRPRYNVILRDDKNYPFIKVTVAEEWPRVMMTRRRNRDKSRYFGPYTSSSAMWATLRLLHSLFPLRRCKGRHPKKRSRPCLNGQMGHCLSPCLGGADRAAYDQAVERVIMSLEGRNRQLVATLRAEMKEAAADQRYEEAAQKRDQIAALEKTVEKQVVASDAGNHDVFGLVLEGGALAVAVLLVRQGTLLGHDSFFLAEPVGSREEILAEVVRRFYGQGREPAAEVLLPWATGEDELLADYLADLRGGRLEIKVPQRGRLRSLLEMAEINALHHFKDQQKRKDSWQVLARQLQKKLQMARLPRRIECVDISNISGQQAVGSLVCFVDGQPAKGEYRHYKIRTVEGPDDYAMMAEVVRRRFDPAKNPLFPDLLLLDGGKGQLGMARRIMSELSLQDRFSVAGIAKERAEEGEKIFLPGRKNALGLDRHSQLLLFLMRIRDEAHRFGITLHRKLRKKDAFSSELDAIAGVGPARKRQLLKELGSLQAVKEATVQRLANVTGIGPALAATIYHALHDRDRAE